MKWRVAHLTLTCPMAFLGCGRTADEWYAEGKKRSDLVQYEKALPCYDKAIEKNTAYVAAWYGKAEALFRLGRNREAEACADKVIQLVPPFPPPPLENSL